MLIEDCRCGSTLQDPQGVVYRILQVRERDILIRSLSNPSFVFVIDSVTLNAYSEGDFVPV